MPKLLFEVISLNFEKRKIKKEIIKKLLKISSKQFSLTSVLFAWTHFFLKTLPNLIGNKYKLKLLIKPNNY